MSPLRNMSSALLGAALLLLVLAACAPRGTFNFAQPIAEAETVEIFLATNRAPVASQANGGFGSARAQQTRFGIMDVSIPPVHQPGTIEWPGRTPPDPAQHFVVTNSARVKSLPQFTRALKQSSQGQDVMLFVHGYNVNNAEAVYRLAQIVHDYELNPAAVLFSWPSAADVRGYIYDRDSVIFARDGLEAVLRTLTSQGVRVHVVAHSMGSQLVVETLRQISIGGGDQVLRRLQGVTLLAPDIDDEVFLRQAERIGHLPQPFTILASQEDRALAIAALLTGKQTRLGSIRNADNLGDLPITILDISAFADGSSLDHLTVATSPAAIAFLRGLIETNALEGAPTGTLITSER